MSLSAQQLKDGNRKLKQWLENDRKVVTYREVSREISCHVNHAKNLLRSYHSSHQVTATYILTGPLLRTSTLTYTQLPQSTQAEPKATQSLAHLGKVKIVDMDEQSDGDRNSEVDEDEDVREGNDEGAADAGALGIKGDDDHEGDIEAEEVPRWGVVLVSEEGLEEKKKLFEQDKVSIRVYALSPTTVKDPGQYLLSNLSIRTNKDYSNPAVYGTITGDGFNNVAEPMRDGGIDFGSTASKSKKEVPAAKAKQDEKSAEAPLQKEKEVKEKNKPDKAAKAEPTPEKPVMAAAERASVKKRRSASPTKQSRDVSPNKAAPEAKKAEPAKAGPSSSQNRADEQAAMEAMMGMDMDQEFGLDDDMDETQDSNAASAVKAEPVERKRKRRTVKKSKMEMDDKGYMVTKDYDTEESYSGESEPETAAKPSGKAKLAAAKAKPPPPAPSRTASTTSVESDRKPNINKPANGALKKGAGGQSTLQGFFKKK